MEKTKLPEYAVRLRELREARGLTQRQASERCTLSKNMIHRYETGEREPKASTLRLLAGFYQVSVDYILGITEKNK
mgnify:FL=1